MDREMQPEARGQHPLVPRGGIYDLPVVGPHLLEVRNFYDGLKPTAGDSAGVALGKNALRYGTVAAIGVAATAAAAIVCL